MISGKLIESKGKLRLARAEFDHIKRELVYYQVEQHPQITRSIVYGKQRRKTRDRL